MRRNAVCAAMKIQRSQKKKKKFNLKKRKKLKKKKRVASMRQRLKWDPNLGVLISAFVFFLGNSKLTLSGYY